MSSNKNGANTERAIVIHPQLTGEPHAVAQVIEEQDVATVVLADPPASRAAAIAHSVQEPAAPALQRAVGLDAFRGFFILAMTLSMAIPLNPELALPQWLYHMQFPAPGEFVQRPGLTWPDLVFPGFLLAMCAAIPLANAPRLARGQPYPAIIWTAMKRVALLFVFALIIGHVLPVFTNDFTKRGNIVSLAGFAVCWALFLRKPPSWSEVAYSRLKSAGWIACAALLFLVPALWGGSFSITRTDNIIRALAIVSLVTTVIWLFTRHNTPARMAVFGVALIMKIATDLQLPGGNLWTALSVPPLFDPWMLELVLVAIPGTVAGDLILKWMGAPEESHGATWSRARLATITAAAFAFVPVTLIGLYLRQVPATGAAVAGLSLLVLALTFNARSGQEKILRQLLAWTCALLVVGLILEPMAGGIQKNPQTISYLIVSAGLSLALLAAATIVSDMLQLARRTTSALSTVGRNPLLAYVAFTMFFNNIAWLTPFGRWHTGSPAAALFGAALMTAAVAGMVILTTRYRLLWKV